jgi:anti-sigma regulatory factor (Ser/Thr protein kinase)/serine/threonine protein phosphatase PrpC
MPPSQTIEVLHPDSVGVARRAARALAETLGFAPTACEEVALAVTEIATNLVRHAQGGKLILTSLAAEGRPGLQVESLDQGPGIRDVEQALADGFSTAGSRGAGLGAVNRLMDELEITSVRRHGTRIVCRKWLREHVASLRSCPLTFGAATRPRRHDEVNGDAFVVKQWAESLLVGLIDGLGHGQFAHRAAQAARLYVDAHFDLPLAQIFRGTCRACRATRGVVMALARFDWGREQVAFASVGNIEARVFSQVEPVRFFLRRGIVGLNAPSPVVTEHRWPPGNVLVLHSDGLSTHWGWKDFPGLPNQPADVAAQALLRTLAKAEDDATAVVVTNAIP